MTHRNVLVVAAHPDDEILGVGGTIARHADNGDTVHVLILAEGATSRDASRDATARNDDIAALRSAAEAAAEVLGAQPPRFCGFPDNRLDGLELIEVAKRVEAIVREVEPTIVYTHHAGDLNVDHRIAHQATLVATRPQNNCPTQAVYSFETVSSTEWSGPAIDATFIPQHFVDIESQLKRKNNALRCYLTEMRPFPHPRSIEATEHLAYWRGASVGSMAAEAFMVVRSLWRD